MGINKFIMQVKETLGLEDPKKATKKKSVKKLLKKLTTKKEHINKLLETKSDKKVSKDLKEELKIIICQIKNGNKILNKL
ncbi:MAG: hypothetical protein DRG78_07545 [Epsilonproteobacteria bacterium]|nr:MAG: hypothetical protein DRG78_07545 [Campylobacterota bacterium]